jgi:hypothetical protein
LFLLASFVVFAGTGINYFRAASRKWRKKTRFQMMESSF